VLDASRSQTGSVSLLRGLPKGRLETRKEIKLAGRSSTRLLEFSVRRTTDARSHLISSLTDTPDHHQPCRRPRALGNSKNSLDSSQVFTRLCVAVCPYVHAVFAVFPGRICPSRLGESRGETRTGFGDWDRNSVEASWSVCSAFQAPARRAPELPSSRLPSFHAYGHPRVTGSFAHWLTGSFAPHFSTSGRTTD